jgi:hypothetical protein
VAGRSRGIVLSFLYSVLRVLLELAVLRGRSAMADVTDLDQVRRRDLLGWLIHEYRLAGLPRLRDAHFSLNARFL